MKDKNQKKYDDVMMETTFVWAKKSKCKKRQVAAVIAKDNVIISIGINGTPKGYERIKINKEDCKYCNGTGVKDNKQCEWCSGFGYIVTEEKMKYECEDEVKICPNCKKEYKNEFPNFCIECGKDLRGVEIQLKTDHEITLHAEQNALINAARLGHSVENSTMYVSTAPCSRCALLIAQAGIKRVVYKDLYKNSKGIEILKSLGITVEKF